MKTTDRRTDIVGLWDILFRPEENIPKCGLLGRPHKNRQAIVLYALQ